MSIFDTNPTFLPFEDCNNVCYNELIKVIYNTEKDRRSYLWSSVGFVPPPIQPYTKSNLKKKFRLYKKLPKDIIRHIDVMIQNIYEDYGVFVKMKIQRKDNGYIKSVVFYKYC